ncbi:LPS translocon maturation chaperone LptM [Marinobacter salicampi]|uniref:LPS translocon maturation chaperone LptM n=1 Tax=Marinobacter salicampi TaxID=435907 RepID=UPI001408E0DE|nr:lipoprotein [Marinobacter salicampi]
MQKTGLMLVLAGAMVALLGCGQKGPLYLEPRASGPEPQASEDAPTAGAPKELDRTLPETPEPPAAGEATESSVEADDEIPERVD